MLRPTRRKLEPFVEGLHADHLVQAYREGFEAILRELMLREGRGEDAQFFRDRLLAVYRILHELDTWTDTWIEQAIGQVYSDAATETRSYLQGLGQKAPARPEFAKVHQRAVDVIAQNVQMNLRAATQYVGRRIHDVFRDVGVLEAQRKFAAGKTLDEMKHEIVRRLLDRGKTCFVDRAGRKWSLERYAAMVARTTTREAATVATLNECREFGIDLVQITEHSPTCEICAPIQGRVFSISGKDKRYPKLLAEYTPPIHPNCRHVLVPYVREFDPDAEEVEKRSRAPRTAPAVRPQLPTQPTGATIKVGNAAVLGGGASSTFVGTIGGKRYVFKLNEPVRALRMLRSNLEAEILAAKIFRFLGVWCPEADFVKVDLGPNVGPGKPTEMLRVEFVEGVKTAQAFVMDHGYEAVDYALFRRLQVIDVLIGNTDRHGGNFFMTADGKVVPIDHNLSFSTDMVIPPGYDWQKGFLDHITRNGVQTAEHIVCRNDIGNWVLSNSTERDYVRIIKEVQQALTDADIERMVSELPDQLAEKARKEELIRILKWRRDNLEKIMEDLW